MEGYLMRVVFVFLGFIQGETFKELLYLSRPQFTDREDLPLTIVP